LRHPQSARILPEMTTTDRQLLLKLRPEGAPTLANFVVGSNEELIQRLRRFDGSDQLYLWGNAGSGRSHLLTSIAREGSSRPVIQLAAVDIGDDLAIEVGSLLLVDDVDHLSDAGQAAIFRIFISARQNGIALLFSGSAPPLQLTMREDLRTRMGQMLIYEIKDLSDADKGAALHHYAQQRGLPMDDTVVRHLLLHGRRDLPSLLATIDRLDEISLARQRPPTLPLLRELMVETRQREMK
jgi:DnaA-homolog protein